MLDFRILGPLEVRDGENIVQLGGSRQRSVLAILLLRANEVVSADRLVDELWGDSPPDDAEAALQAHVSRLRKALTGAAGLIVTRAPGYVLQIAPEQLDLERFRALARRGSSELEGGDPEAAARTLREALALWRGPPLDDLANEPFAAAFAGALDEERLAALETRVEADLGRGRHAELVGELTSFVRQDPLRERFRAQLMLALYRSGRQTDALEAYADARHTLVSELGLEPGPDLQALQQAVLTHDAALRAPKPAPQRRRRRLGLAAAAAGAAVVAAVVAALTLRKDDAAGSVVAPGAGVAIAVDAKSGEIERHIPAGRTPSALAVGGEGLWLVDADARTVLHLLPTSRVVETLATGATPTDVAFGAESVWVANGRRLPNAQFVGPVATAVARLDPTTRTERTSASLPRQGGALSNLVDNHLAVSSSALWAIAPDFSVVRIDARTGAVSARTREVQAAAVASGPAGIWVLAVDGTVVRLDERTARTTFRTRLPTASVGAIAVGRDAVWVTSPGDGRLWRIRGGRSASVGAIDLDRGVSDLAVGDDAIWVANPLAGTLLRVDPKAARLEKTIDLDAVPRSVALDGETVWVAAVAEPTPSAARLRGIRVFPDSTCEPVVRGDGPADVLIVSDLPLQGGVRVSALQMTQAIAFVLREHGFRAGRFRVAYQSCDDSIASTGLYDEPKCAANARAYGANDDVVGVIGTLNSACAVTALPELNRAPDGPLAMVSPLNSFVGLTRAGPGVDPVLPAALYPTGVRNFVRVYPTDDLESAALALFARDRGRTRLFVLDDGDTGYGALQATAFETAARRIRLAVLARASWDPQATGYAALARRVAASGATAVFLGGLVDTNAGRVVRDLRARLRPDVDLLGPSGLTGVPLLLRRSSGAAAGMYLSLAGVVPERLPPAGARWVRRFAATQRGVPVEPSAVYAAQATEVLLDAIARSDGTRASVVRELFATRIEDGLLGSFGFDENGDVSESPVTIVRVAPGGTSNTVGSVDGARIETITRPSPDLVR